MFAEIKQSLHEFGVDFDVYFHENSLHDSGAVQRAVARLREQGRIYEADGAIWLRTTDFGDDKDRVVIKSDGEAAYIAGDLAYYLDKRERGFNRVIIMLGADHHGYVGRLMAMCACFGDDPGVNLQILIGQLVNLVKDGEPVRMGKRAGNVITLEDLVDAVGVDAARYQLTRSSADSTLDIDLDLLTRATNDNPVHYVQYAHARTVNVMKNAAAVGIAARRLRPEPADPRDRDGAADLARRVPAGWSPRPPSCASRTGWPATWRRWRGSSTAGTTPAGCCPRATRRSPTSTGPGSGSTPPPGRCWPTACRLLGVSAPERK